MSKLPNAYALLIGVGDEELDTVDDALDINNILIDETLAGYSPENVILVTGKKATREGILTAFDELISKTNKDSSVFLYYSGHGGFQLDKYFIQPYGMHNDMTEEEFVDAWVSAEELKEKINTLTSKRLIFFLDCCQAEGMTQGVLNLSQNANIAAKKKIEAKGAVDRFKNAEGLATKIDNERGIAIVSSCRGDQESFQIPDDRNSLFTKCLLEVLTGKHKTYFEEPYIRISEVSGYLQREVPKRIKVWEKEQNPYVNLQQYDDFALSYVPQAIREQLVTIPHDKETNTTHKKHTEVVTVFGKESPNATNLLLFIHGFSGEASDTFGKIPELLAADPNMAGWNMKPLGYSQNVNPELGKDIWAGVDDINKISDYLTTSLMYRFDNYDRIAIVAHSLGGLVAQKAIIDLDKKNRDRISHLLLFGTPSGGIESSSKPDIWKNKLKELSNDGPFINTLREDWKQAFENGLPFKLKVAAAIDDEYVTVQSCHGPFKEENCEYVDDNHLNMVKPKDEDDDAYNLILNTITNNEFYNQYTNKEEINLVLGKYESVKKQLLPQKNSLDANGLKQLIFSLEGLDERETVMEILNEHPLAKENTELMGLLAGRYKRAYLKLFSKSDGDAAFNYYSKALEIATVAENDNQIYYHAINLAFLSIVIEGNEGKMMKYAKQALKATESCRDNLWKYATIAEASMYIDDMEKAKEYYSKAAEMAEIREKISIHTNAYAGYTSLTGVQKSDDEFIKFLKSNFLS
jgi:pimeloyl-ACP methyl ester carboxylesterase